tara:strand:- start:14260 stop:15366 length:1107 start_codon:yes stop_codon:yes gene_type:complete
MKNTPLITLIVISLFSSFIYSQRPNTKKIGIPYIQAPLNPLEKNIETYHSSVVNNSTVFKPQVVSNSTSFQSMGLTNATVFQPSQQKIILSGFNQMNSLGDTDLEIRYVVNNVSFSSSVFKEKFKKKINDSTYIDAVGGKYRVDATVNYSEYVIDNKNDKKIISNEGIIINNFFLSSLYREYATAVKIHSEKKDIDAMNLYYQIINRSLRSFENGINNNYGFTLKHFDVSFARGRGSKYDYSDLSKAFENIESIREIVKNGFSGDTPPRFGNFSEKMRNEIAQKVDECINIWEEAIKEYVPKKRRTRIGDKIIDHLHINLSAAYFLKGNWDKAYSSLSRVSLNKKEIKEASNFRAKIEDYANRININK